VQPGAVAGQVDPVRLAQCLELAFSVEEDFLTQGPEPFDGNPIISDGDLLGLGGALCARNAELLNNFDIPAAFDLGLDAADVITATENFGGIVAFSTELDSTNLGQFTSGDLLVTNGAIIRNQALTAPWQVGYDIGLDAVHFVGEPIEILRFLEAALGQSPVGADGLAGLFETYPTVDIWFSTEGTFGPVAKPVFLDGDLLSARTGTIVAANADLLHPSIPAGIPNDGVDFGLDAATTDRQGTRRSIHYSTEILYEGDVGFTDGDVLRYNNGVVAINWDLILPFEPKTDMLGLDALSVSVPGEPECISRITKIGGVDVADINAANGMVLPLAISTINAPQPFGGRIPLEGTICDDVDRFRVVYREAGSSDPWEPIDVPAPRNWQVKIDSLVPPVPDCLGSTVWSSTPDGWFDGLDYRFLSEAALGGCNPGLALTVWESTGAVAGSDALYELLLVTDTASGVVSDTLRLVQLDNTAPVANLDKQPGTCDSITGADMPLMVTGRISDTHFYQYRLAVSGDSYGVHTYPSVAYYDDPTDNIISTGTLSWMMFVNLHTVDVNDLATNPVECGYTVHFTAWDRTVVNGFHYPGNFATRCVGCRHTNDYWTFDYTP
jgi:hypothetical protein